MKTTQLNEVNEFWADIEGYEGLYQVSNLGRVRSLGRNYKRESINKTVHVEPKILTPRQHPSGYLAVMLFTYDTVKEFYIHRLVAQHFIPNPENKPIANHLDEDKTNNSVYNLAWATYKENSQWSTKTARAQRKQSLADYLTKTWEETNGRQSRKEILFD